MPGLYDQLSAQLGDDEPSGITPLDIADLPQEQKQVMLALLRDPNGSGDGLSKQALLAKLGGAANFDAVIGELSRNGWLIVSGDPPNQRYRVNLRAKRGKGSSGLWSSLADRITKDKK